MTTRADYVTDMIGTWIISEGEFIDVDGERLRIAEHAAFLAKERRYDDMRKFITRVINLGGFMGPSSGLVAAWEVGQEMAANDYDRVDWVEVGAQLRASFDYR